MARVSPGQLSMLDRVDGRELEGWRGVTASAVYNDFSLCASPLPTAPGAIPLTMISKFINRALRRGRYVVTLFSLSYAFGNMTYRSSNFLLFSAFSHRYKWDY